MRNERVEALGNTEQTSHWKPLDWGLLTFVLRIAKIRGLKGKLPSSSGGVLSWLHVAPKSCRSRRAAGEQRLVYLWLWSFILLREVFRPTEGIPGTFGFLTHTSGEKHALGYKATFVAPHKVHSGSGRASVTAAAPQPLLRTRLPNTRGISA